MESSGVRVVVWCGVSYEWVCGQCNGVGRHTGREELAVDRERRERRRAERDRDSDDDAPVVRERYVRATVSIERLHARVIEPQGEGAVGGDGDFRDVRVGRERAPHIQQSTCEVDVVLRRHYDRDRRPPVTHTHRRRLLVRGCAGTKHEREEVRRRVGNAERCVSVVLGVPELMVTDVSVNCAVAVTTMELTSVATDKL